MKCISPSASPALQELKSTTNGSLQLQRAPYAPTAVDIAATSSNSSTSKTLQQQVRNTPTGRLHLQLQSTEILPTKDAAPSQKYISPTLPQLKNTPSGRLHLQLKSMSYTPDTTPRYKCVSPTLQQLKDTPRSSTKLHGTPYRTMPMLTTGDKDATPSKKYISPTLQQLRNTPTASSVKVKCQKLKEKYARNRCLAMKQNKDIIGGVAVWPELDMLTRQDWHLLLLTCCCSIILTLFVMYCCYGWVLTSAMASVNILSQAKIRYSRHSKQDNTLFGQHYHLANTIDHIKSLYAARTSDIGLMYGVITLCTYMAAVVLIIYLIDHVVFTNTTNRLLPRALRFRCAGICVLMTLTLTSLLVFLAMLYIEYDLQTLITHFTHTFGSIDLEHHSIGISGGVGVDEFRNISAAVGGDGASCHLVTYWEKTFQQHGVLTIFGDAVTIKQVEYYIWAYGCTVVSLLYKWLRSYTQHIHKLYSVSR